MPSLQSKKIISLASSTLPYKTAAEIIEEEGALLSDSFTDMTGRSNSTSPLTLLLSLHPLSSPDVIVNTKSVLLLHSDLYWLPFLLTRYRSMFIL